jgi:phthalate 4,5-dioxygenase
MLTHEDNELLTRTGPGTPMGDLMRRYWMPAMLSEELPENDCDPVRLRLLGENLVAFRDSEGRVGVLDENCAHRCASLVYGRNEEGGLRCIYHGWKYAVDGTVLETPPEPAESNFKRFVRQPAYLVREAADVIWVYMGPKDKVPDFPEWEWMKTPADHRSLAKTMQECNWAQALEGDIDSSHSDYLHSSDIRGRPSDHAPRIEVEDTLYGYRYAAVRKPDQDPDKQKYVRITVFAAPFHTFTPPLRTRRNGELYEAATHRVYVPVDDYNHAFFSFTVSRHGPIDTSQRQKEAGLETAYKPAGNIRNNHLQDRMAMRAGNWTGIQGVRAQDRAVTESMGEISPRHKEHLGTSDMAVIRMRKRMLDAVKAFMNGEEPIGLDPGIHHDQIRAEERVVPTELPWQMVVDETHLVGEAVPVSVTF